ncbi:hypothetical protein GQX73_g2579 [Xylaria multiplex]|uniref:Uncharacterized protein n=1 Tax=Xylaria multiplex TaxID=323545 RepID=A0A7C8IYW0_9PEZI|nr:hypothetical protein GQX73_g2579 [Xylaria multiplex]
MHVSALNALFIAIQAVCVYALPPKIQSADELDAPFFTPSGPIPGWPFTSTTSFSTTGAITNDIIPWTSTTTISGWPQISSPSTLSYFTTTTSQVVTATTITVTDNSITWTPTQPISGWPPASSNTQTAPGQQLTETFTITYTSYSEETISLPPPTFTFVTVTAGPTFASTIPFTVVTVTASASAAHSGPTTPRFTTITVSEITLWPTPATTPSSTQTSQLVTLTLSSSSINESLNSTTVSYSSTVLTLSPPPTFATGTATIGLLGRKRHI